MGNCIFLNINIRWSQNRIKLIMDTVKNNLSFLV